ncbi:hypothetical protein BH10ACT8_BH10ACT8_02800 [soil metagenome]|jgi:hypothetical protein
MAVRRKPGLDADALAALVVRLAEGKRPRVQFSGPQFAEGTSGTVVRIGDPAVDGADFIRVRATINGQADELSFAPNELQLPGSATKRSAATAKRAKNTPAAAAATATTRARRPQPGPATPVEATASVVTTASAPEAMPKTPAPQGRSSSRRKPAAAPKISVSITSAGAAWTVSGQRGARTLAKGVDLTPGVVTAIADLLGHPGISEAVAEVNDSALAEAEQRAEVLRAELAALDAVLAAHRAPR